jgi:cytochrome c5
MSDDPHDDHSTFIKTPKQLIVAVVAFFAVVILLPVMFSQLVTAGRSAAPDEELTAKLIQPVARVEMAAGGGAAAAKGAKTGEQVVAAVCGACHTAGVAGAPKTGDNAGWAPRLALGLNGLTKSAIAGKNAMPPRGGGADLTDDEIARAVAYMANKSGASFKEPPVAAK